MYHRQHQMSYKTVWALEGISHPYFNWPVTSDAESTPVVGWSFGLKCASAVLVMKLHFKLTLCIVSLLEST